MPFKLRAMTKQDYLDIGMPLTATGFTDPYKLLEDASCVSDADFENSVDAIKQNLANRNVRYVLKLAVPTFNYVLGTSGASLLKTILGVPADVWTSIVDVSKIYDKDADEMIALEDACPDGDYLYGAQIAEHLIDKFSIKDAIIETLQVKVLDYFRDGTHMTDIGIIGKQNEENAIYLTSGFYFVPNDMDGAISKLKRGRTWDMFVNGISTILFPGYKSRLSILLSLEDKDPLYGMLNYYVSVLPSELRPKVQNRKHPLTARYAHVLSTNTELVAFLNHTQVLPRSLSLKVKALDAAVSKLQYKNVGLGQKDVKLDDLAVMERFKQKKGQVRLHNLGKSQDNSGRSVVTINPWLPVDQINLPAMMLPALYEVHVLPYLKKNLEDFYGQKAEDRDKESPYNRIRLNNLKSPVAQKEMLRIILAEGLNRKIPAILGRQPSLHKHSVQAFYVGVSQGKSIEVSPLVCPAFNMDFDGDTGHVELPITMEAVDEVRNLMLTTQNLYLPKTGECTIVPRQDMLYGLYVCTRNKYNRNGAIVATFNTEGTIYAEKKVYKAVLSNRIKVWDLINVDGVKMTAGDAAFMACFKHKDIAPRGSAEGLAVTQIDKKTIEIFVNHILRRDASDSNVYPVGQGKASTNTFIGSINHMVELGFKVARLYPVSLSLIRDAVAIPEYDNAMTNFYTDLEEDNFYFSMGLETEDNYTIAFNECLDKLARTIESNLNTKLGDDNGYYLLADSGARGSKSNLLQIFAYKGQVKRNESENFDALLKSSYVDQLNAFDAYVDAYGGRQGQMDKSLKTGDTGYVSRQLWQCLQGNSITSIDCGTKEGIEISKAFLATMIEANGTESDIEKVRDLLIQAIEGRYLLNAPVGAPDEIQRMDDNINRLNNLIRSTTDPVESVKLHKELEQYTNAKQTRIVTTTHGMGINRPLTKQQAIAIANDNSISKITMRSPIKCKNPCCVKCYGIDWGTHRLPVIGTPVDIVAAHSVGEPSTQLTMKAFQKGGVAVKGEMTSSFDKVKAYIHTADISKLKGYAGYDPVAWIDGKTIITADSDITKKVVRIEGSSTKVIVPKEMRVKEQAVKGQGLCYKRGDYNILELVKYQGINEAQRYLVFKLYNLFSGEVQLKFIHLELLVAAMTRHKVIDTSRQDLKVGQTYTTRELYSGTLDKTIYETVLINVLDTIKASSDALDSVIMEDQVDALSRSCLFELSDSLQKPINRMVIGQGLTCGSAVKGFIANRKEY